MSVCRDAFCVSRASSLAALVRRSSASVRFFSSRLVNFWMISLTVYPTVLRPSYLKHLHKKLLQKVIVDRLGRLRALRLGQTRSHRKLLGPSHRPPRRVPFLARLRRHHPLHLPALEGLQLVLHLLPTHQVLFPLRLDLVATALVVLEALGNEMLFLDGLVVHLRGGLDLALLLAGQSFHGHDLPVVGGPLLFEGEDESLVHPLDVHRLVELDHEVVHFVLQDFDAFVGRLFVHHQRVRLRVLLQFVLQVHQVRPTLHHSVPHLVQSTLPSRLRPQVAQLAE